MWSVSRSIKSPTSRRWEICCPLEGRVGQDSAVNLRDFTPQSVRGSHVRGQLVGLPDSHQVVVMFWNKNLLARAGLDPEAPPATWDALRDAAHRVRTQVEVRTVLLPWGFQFYEMSTREQAYAWFIEWVWRAGGDVWNADRTRVTLDQPEALAALEFQVALLHEDRTAVRPGTPVSQLINNAHQGRVGMWMTTAPEAPGLPSPGARPRFRLWAPALAAAGGDDAPPQ